VKVQGDLLDRHPREHCVEHARHLAGMRDADRVADRDFEDAEIRQAYIDKFGPSILLKPESGGLGILVWGLPAAALVLGAGGLVLALRRWRREPHLRPTDADRELVQRARS